MEIVDLDRSVRCLKPGGGWSDPAPLSSHREAAAYVLLGPPGAGKSTAFERESAQTGAELVTVRDFLAIGRDRMGTLFLDGLDEVRAGVSDPRRPFDAIRSRLNPGSDRFRLSCREVDWLGENDRSRLDEARVLRLEPLSHAEQRRILDTPEPEAFLAAATGCGLGGLLGSPQTLTLLARVFARDGEFPTGRTETFEQACRLLISESNEEHRIAAPLPAADESLAAASHLCAVSLLSGSDCPAGNAVVKTRLFRTAGGRIVPAHANLAAFLAARHLAERVRDGVPRRRVLALLTGRDGVPPTSLRGLAAWLAASSSDLRLDLIRADPVAVLLYGDVGEFPERDKALLLKAIECDAARLHGDYWPDSALEPLATPDMEAEVRAVLQSPDRSVPKQRVVELVAKALAGTPLAKRLAGLLGEIVRDGTRSTAVRRRALDAIRNQAERLSPDEPMQAAAGFRAGEPFEGPFRRRAPEPDADFLDAVRRSLRENQANPALLHELARLYSTDREKFRRALGGDEALVDWAIEAIRSAPDREDLPSFERVLTLRSKNERDWLTLPVLVGFAGRSAGSALDLGEDRLRILLGLRLARADSGEEAAWYGKCLEERPELVADVLLRFTRVALVAGQKHFPDFYRLSRSPSYAEVARQVTMPLLRAFPLRANAEQLGQLTELLQSGLIHCDPGQLRDLIERKIALGSITRAQRRHWIAAGVALDPGRFGKLLTEVGDAPTRRRILEQMFPPETSLHGVPGLFEKLKIETIEFLVSEMGAGQGPPAFEAGVSFGWGSSLGIESLISMLARRSSEAALERLLHQPSLSRWKPHLERALHEHRVSRRDAEHAPLSWDAVDAALRNGPPAGPADLLALVADRLERIGEELRTTNANLWRQFWTEDEQRNQPKDENACRDALLSLLRERLPEGQYAGNRGADLRVAFGEWSLPIEIRKSSHADLWRAASDLATEGLGVYLVLWFGSPARYGSASEIRDRLEAELAPGELHRVAVVVMDVTPP